MRRLALIAFCMAIPCPAQLSPQLQNSIDDVVLRTLAETGVPGASVAVAKDKSVYAKACGFAKLDPKTPATAVMRFKIARRHRRQVPALIDARRGNHPPAVVVTHLRLSGLLSAGLRGALRGEGHDGESDSGQVGEKGSGFRPRHEIAIQQYSNTSSSGKQSRKSREHHY
jgi:hypothetical protein